VTTSKINDCFAKAVSGDLAAEKALFELLGERFRFITHHKIGWNQDADDVAQEALLVVSKNYRNLDVRHSFAAWAVKVLSNRILEFHDSNRRRMQREVAEEENENLSGAVVEPKDSHLKLDLIRCFRKLLSINRQYGRILNLRAQGNSTEEICGKLGISRNNLYISLHRARTILAECLQGRSINK